MKKQIIVVIIIIIAGISCSRKLKPICYNDEGISK